MAVSILPAISVNTIITYFFGLSEMGKENGKLEQDKSEIICTK